MTDKADIKLKSNIYSNSGSNGDTTDKSAGIKAHTVDGETEPKILGSDVVFILPDIKVMEENPCFMILLNRKQPADKSEGLKRSYV